MSGKRVVVTGMGVISPVGLDVGTMWRNLVAGRSGIAAISLFDARDLGVQIAGEAHGFEPTDYMTAKEARRADRYVQFSLAALQEALAQSGLVIDSGNAADVGAIVGSGMGGIDTYSRELYALQSRGPRRVSPFLIPMITVDVPAVAVALHTGAQGPTVGVASACATGADAIGQAYETIRRGHARAMFGGAFEAAITPIGIAAFDRMRALSHRYLDPEQASRPFDAGRDGFVMAEGGGLLLLEDLEYALDRGAQPLAEVAAYAATSDALHISAPDPEGKTAARCISLALERAGAGPDQVCYINAHGTGTPAGDPAEVAAINRALGERASRIPVSSTKSMTGHLLGGAGAVEAAICVQVLQSGVCPPTINLTDPDPACDLNHVAPEAQTTELAVGQSVALSNSFGFGGHNVTLAFRSYQPTRQRS